jgi:hypothetical protein
MGLVFFFLGSMLSFSWSDSNGCLGNCLKARFQRFKI